MDRNTIIGLVLIFLIMVGFGWLNAPSKEERMAAARMADSLRQVQAEEQLQRAQSQTALQATSTTPTDSATARAQLGAFAAAAQGSNDMRTMENDLMRVRIANRGGRIHSVELKGYTTYGGHPLVLFSGDENTFGLQFWGNNNSIETNHLYFSPSTPDTLLLASDAEQQLIMRLQTSDSAYIDYIYTMRPGSYLMDLDVRFHGMERSINTRGGMIDLNWLMHSPQLEKGLTNEKQYTTVGYMFHDGEYEELNARKDGEQRKELSTKVKWVDFKQQFFSSILVAKGHLVSTTLLMDDHPKAGYVRTFGARVGLPFDGKPDETIGLSFYFGPNHFKTMDDYEMGFEKVIPLGRNIVRWINKYVVINVFNWLNRSISNYGLIILILTLLLKIVLFPITYKSYTSSAKMRVLRPQIEEINAKYPKQEDAMKKQQATMALYKKVGVSPMGGCLPMLIQFPILIAMYRFFPASVELRQQGFLWADDLSAYDSILSLPFSIPWYGDHVSLFALLMAVTLFVQSKMNADQMGSTNNQMPGMKFMMTWMMPIMLLFMFNSFSAGLNYYYFLANLITLLQTFVIRQLIDDEKVLAKLHAHAQKAAPPTKSKWQQRLEQMQRQQQEMQRQRINKKR
ncbi:MAG: membrane protein insertase YidC [Bacteroidales bacterium]|nr:membrane protein insertase YidC [Bacteroidales bacterium]